MIRFCEGQYNAKYAGGAEPEVDAHLGMVCNGNGLRRPSHSKAHGVKAATLAQLLPQTQLQYCSSYGHSTITVLLLFGQIRPFIPWRFLGQFVSGHDVRYLLLRFVAIFAMAPPAKAVTPRHL